MDYTESAIEAIDDACAEYRRWLCRIAEIIAKKERTETINADHIKLAKETIS